MGESNLQPQLCTFDENTLDQLKITITEANKKPRNKDRWEKLSIVGTFLSNVVLAIVFFGFTYNYNIRQEENENRIRELEVIHNIRLRESEVIHKFVPQLISENETEKEIALIAISNLTNTKLAIALAEQIPSSGSARATKIFSNSLRTEPEDRKAAQDAHQRIVRALKRIKQ